MSSVHPGCVVMTKPSLMIADMVGGVYQVICTACGCIQYFRVHVLELSRLTIGDTNCKISELINALSVRCFLTDWSSHFLLPRSRNLVGICHDQMKLEKKIYCHRYSICIVVFTLAWARKREEKEDFLVSKCQCWWVVIAVETDGDRCKPVFLTFYCRQVVIIYSQQPGTHLVPVFNTRKRSTGLSSFSLP